MNQTILRNLFYTLKRFRTASVLNLFGLSFAFAAFIVIMMKVNYERGFDPITIPWAICRADPSTT